MFDGTIADNLRLPVPTATVAGWPASRQRSGSRLAG